MYIHLLPFLISFGLISLAEIGDKTQLLIISMASKGNPYKILIGVAIGTLLSHGIAVFIGKQVSYLSSFQIYLQIVAYISFIIFGVFSILKKEKEENLEDKKSNTNIILSSAFAIFIGELGDKTELASIALSFKYPDSTIALIFGAIFGMLLANSIGILLGIYMHKRIPKNILNLISNIAFILFGIIGLISIK